MSSDAYVLICKPHTVCDLHIYGSDHLVEVIVELARMFGMFKEVIALEDHCADVGIFDKSGLKYIRVPNVLSHPEYHFPSVKVVSSKKLALVWSNLLTAAGYQTAFNIDGVVTVLDKDYNFVNVLRLPEVVA